MAEQTARQISRYWVNEIADGEIPNQIGFLEMYHLADIRSWDLLKQWKTHRAYESIRAQIGVSYGAQPVYLDIHEKQHGPARACRRYDRLRQERADPDVHSLPDAELSPGRGRIYPDRLQRRRHGESVWWHAARRRRHYEYLRIRARRGKECICQRQPDAAGAAFAEK